MPKSRFIQNSFTSGVLSPLLAGRFDLNQYYQALEQGDNVVLIPQGGLKRRPGTKYIDLALPVLSRNTTTPTMPEGGTAANINDDNDATNTATTNNITTTDPYVVAKYDLGSATYIEVADVNDILLTVSGTSSEFVVQSSTDDVTYTTRATVPLIGTSSIDARLKVATTAQYWRLARVGSTDLTTNKVQLSEFNLWEKTATLSNVELKDFSVSTDSHYLLAFTDGNCRIFNKATDLYVADIKTPYVSADVGQLRSTQSEQVMLLSHEDYPVRRITNLQTDTDWSTDLPTFTNVPQYDFNDSSSPTPTSEVQVLTFSAGWVAGDTFQLDLEGILSKNITFVGDATAAEQTSTAFNIQKNIQDMPIVGETGVSVARTGVLTYTVTISGESTKAFKLFSGFPTAGTGSKTLSFAQTTQGVARKEDIWSSTRGYPKTIAFYEGRLFFGGTKAKPQTLLASRSGAPFDFDISEGFDDEAIFVTLATKKLNDITDIFPGRRLQIFTSGSEFTVNESPITPENITITPQTSHGSIKGVESREIDGATIFIDRNGKTVREYLYNFNEDAYISNDTSVLSPELINQPVDMAILGGTQSDDANWVFLVNQDGTGAVLNTLRSQDIKGFTKWTTSGQLTDCTVVDDELYMINKRTINSVEGYYIEKWDFEHQTDNAITQDLGSKLTTVTGLDHLEGETVRVVGDGNVLANQTVASGQITIEVASQVVQVGLDYVPTFRPMPMSSNFGAGPNQMRLKKIVRMNMRVYNTGGMAVDGVEVPVRYFGDASISPLDAPPTDRTGIIEDVHNINGWGRDVMPIITQVDPVPMQILSIEYEVESS